MPSDWKTFPYYREGRVLDWVLDWKVGVDADIIIPAYLYAQTLLGSYFFKWFEYSVASLYLALVECRLFELLFNYRL